MAKRSFRCTTPAMAGEGVQEKSPNCELPHRPTQ